jgi:hypothetical protein
VWRFVADNRRPDELVDYGSTVSPMVPTERAR